MQCTISSIQAFFHTFVSTFHVLRKEKHKETISHLVKDILVVPSTQTQIITRSLVGPYMERGRREKAGLGLQQITTSGKILSSRCLGNEKVLDALSCILLSLRDPSEQDISSLNNMLCCLHWVLTSTLQIYFFSLGQFQLLLLPSQSPPLFKSPLIPCHLAKTFSMQSPISVPSISTPKLRIFILPISYYYFPTVSLTLGI